MPHRGALPEIVTQPRVALRLTPFAASEGQVATMQVRFPRSTEARVKNDSEAVAAVEGLAHLHRSEVPQARLSVCEAPTLEQGAVASEIVDQEDRFSTSRRMSALFWLQFDKASCMPLTCAGRESELAQAGLLRALEAWRHWRSNAHVLARHGVPECDLSTARPTGRCPRRSSSW
jgi:hypothetical protein